MSFAIINECQTLIGNNRIPQAIQLFEVNFTDDDSIIFIKGLSEEVNRVDRAEMLGLLLFREIGLARNQIAYRFLTYLTKLKNEIANKKSILFLGANHSTLNPLNIDGEGQIISSILEQNSYFALRSWLKTTKKHVLSLTNEYRPIILHFACHGTEMGLYLESDPPGVNNGFLNLSDFKDIIARRVDMVQCLILSACNSRTIGEQVKNFIPNVIVCNQKIHDSASILFAEGFYHSIHTQNTLLPDYRKAYDSGIERLQVLNLNDSFTVEFI